MMETEPTFIHHTAGFRVSVIIRSPHCPDVQVCKTPLQNTLYGFRYETLSPIRLACPVADFRLVRQDSCDMRAFPEQQADASDRLSGFFQDNGVCLRSGKADVWGGQPAAGPISGSFAYLYNIPASDSRQGRRISRSVVS